MNGERFDKVHQGNNFKWSKQVWMAPVPARHLSRYPISTSWMAYNLVPYGGYLSFQIRIQRCYQEIVDNDVESINFL